MRHLPGDAVQAAALRVLEGETEMHVFEDDWALAQDNTAHAKHGFWIALTERLQRLELFHESIADLPRG